MEIPAPPMDAPNSQLPVGSISAEAANAATRMFTGYAPPMSWGPWVEVGAHGGPASFSISYEAIGDTMVYGTVNYYSRNGWVTEFFKDSVTVLTGNAWAAVKVCFYGSPLGSTVTGYVDP